MTLQSVYNGQPFDLLRFKNEVVKVNMCGFIKLFIQLSNNGSEDERVLDS